MSFWSKMFGGSSVKTMPSDRPLEDFTTDAAGDDPGLGYWGKYNKKLLKRMEGGEDVSGYGEFNVLRQNQAADEQGIKEDYMTGANALISQAGGEQSNLLQRAKDIALEKSRQQHGMNMVSALTNLREGAGSAFEGARQFRVNSERAREQARIGTRLGYYGQRYKLVQDPGLMNTISQGAGTAGALMAL